MLECNVIILIIIIIIIIIKSVACILLLQDEQAAVMERLVWEPRPAELLSTVHFKQVWH